MRLKRHSRVGKLTGMTGFARTGGEQEGVIWTLEARSVNGKGLDVRLRLPSELSNLDGPIQKIFAGRFNRGNIQISTDIQYSSGETEYVIDESLFDLLAKFSKAKTGAGNPDTLLAVPGVVTARKQSLPKAQQKRLEAALLLDFASLAKDLEISRDSEGKALKPIFQDALSRLEELISHADAIAGTQPSIIKARLQERISDLGADLPVERLAQEAALLAQKADVREELDRLKAHCKQAKNLLSAGSPVGRKLNFLCQELGREINTLCTKSTDIELTQIGLDMKNVAEQFREQAANVE